MDTATKIENKQGTLGFSFVAFLREYMETDSALRTAVEAHPAFFEVMLHAAQQADSFCSYADLAKRLQDQDFGQMVQRMYDAGCELQAAAVTVAAILEGKGEKLPEPTPEGLVM